MSALLNNLRTYLIAQNVARDPRVAGAQPPLWRHPGTGAPAPGEKTGVENDAAIVLSAFHSGAAPAPRFEENRRKDVIDMWFRATTMPEAEEYYKLYREAVIGHGPNVKTQWQMASLLIVESIEWRPFQFLSYENGTYTFTQGTLYETLVV